MLGLALLAAVGVARTIRGAGSPPRAARRQAVMAGLAGLLLFEYANAPLAFVDGPAVDTPVGRWLRDAPEPGPVAYLPLGFDRENTPAMVASLQHGRPIVNGYSGQRPASYTAIVESLATLPGIEGQAMLRELGVRFVVSPERWDVSRAASPFIERATFGGQVIYEVRWTAESEAALVAAPAASLPAPGPLPFRQFEEVAYSVKWVGDLPAGTIRVTAAAATAAERERWPDAAWRFEASATTADWVSRVFEAHDVFTTLATADLSPLVQTRHIDEGARELTRAYVYDASRRQVRVGASGEAAASPDAEATPLVAGARDAVSALFYVRTLPLSVGTELAIPVNDAGRNLTVRIRGDGLETVAGPGGQTEALRLRVAIERRLERRRSVGGTLWLSTDARRVPVRLDLTAGFGQLRLELVDYRP
jgi:hypothetical protein